MGTTYNENERNGKMLIIDDELDEKSEFYNSLMYIGDFLKLNLILINQNRKADFEELLDENYNFKDVKFIILDHFLNGFCTESGNQLTGINLLYKIPKELPICILTKASKWEAIFNEYFNSSLGPFPYMVFFEKNEFRNSNLETIKYCFKFLIDKPNLKDNPKKKLVYHKENRSTKSKNNKLNYVISFQIYFSYNLGSEKLEFPIFLKELSSSSDSEVGKLISYLLGIEKSLDLACETSQVVKEINKRVNRMSHGLLSKLIIEVNDYGKNKKNL